MWTWVTFAVVTGMYAIMRRREKGKGFPGSGWAKKLQHNIKQALLFINVCVAVALPFGSWTLSSGLHSVSSSSVSIFAAVALFLGLVAFAYDVIPDREVNGLATGAMVAAPFLASLAVGDVASAVQSVVEGVSQFAMTAATLPFK